MGFCTNCGSPFSEGTSFCTKCGTQGSASLVAPPVATQTIEVQAPHLWHVTYATGQRGGPFTDDDIRGMIARQEIKVTDSIVAQGGSAWVPITQSPFGSLIATQARINRLASSTCPQCGGAMVVILRRSGASKGWFILGFLTIWAFGFGLIFLIIGYIVGRNPVPRYECPLCKYKAK